MSSTAFRAILMLSGLLAVSACSDEKTPAGPPPGPAPAASPAAGDGTGAEVLVYRCDDGQAVRASYPDRDTAVVEYQGRSRVLKASTAASGARYVGEGLHWWTKGMTQGAISPLAPGEDIASAAGVNCAVAPPSAPVVAPAAAPAPPIVAAPPPKPETSLIEPSRDLGGVLPLKHGVFVEASQDCGSPPNAALRRYDGQGLGGAHTRACRAKVLSHKGAVYEIEQSCIDAGAGPAPRSTDRQTIVIANNLEFTQRGRGGEQTFRYCAASLLPPGLK